MVGRPIYLDNHATTPVDPRVVKAMVRVLTHSFGNPNSKEHTHGGEAAALVEAARVHVAALLGAEPNAIHFTASASDALAWAINDASARVAPSQSLRVIASPIEHPSVLEPLDELSRSSAAELQFLRVDHHGRLSHSHLADLLSAGADLVCVMAANNEIGTVNHLRAIAEMTVAAGSQLLVDATQAAGRLQLRASEWGVTYLVASAHKMYGPKGCGVLVGDLVTPGPRGTPNVPAIVGFGEACRLRDLEMASDEQRIATLRDTLQARLLAGVPDLTVNGDQGARLSGNLHVALPGIPADAIVARLAPHVSLSTGAACSAGAEGPSHVLRAIDMPWDLTDSSIRIGLGKFTTHYEVEQAAQRIIEAAAAIRALT